MTRLIDSTRLRIRRWFRADIIGGSLQLAVETSKGNFALLVALAVVGAILPPLILWQTRSIVNRLAAHQAGRVVSTTSLVRSVGFIAVLSGLAYLVSRLEESRRYILGVRVGFNCQEQFLSRAARLEMEDIDKSEIHDQMLRASRDLSWRPTQLMVSCVEVIRVLFGFLGIAGVLWSIHPILALLPVAAFGPTYAIRKRANRRVYEANLSFSAEEREVEYLTELMVRPRPAEEVRAFSLENYLLGRYRQAAGVIEARLVHAYRRLELGSLLSAFFYAGALIVAYAFVVNRAISGTLTVGDFAVVVGAYAAALGQLASLTSAAAQIDQHRLFLEDFFGFLNVPAKRIEERLVGHSFSSRPDSVTFDHVSFRYPSGVSDAVSDVSFCLERGRLTALVGENGAGKSTLIRLLLRLYEQTSGTIRINGTDIRELDRTELRIGTAAIFQDFTTFEFSVRENVGLGREGTSRDQEVWSALETADAADFVRRLDGTINARIGRLFAGGHELSGGQKQRLALARLFFSDNAWLWILDEPTASLDPEAEARTFEQLKMRLEERIGLVVSHRFGTVRMADQILVMDKGVIVERGDHASLMARAGLYARLFETQAAGYR